MTDKRVLVVEDDEIMAEYATRCLINAGYEVVGCAASEAEAIAIGRATAPPFAVVDIQLAPGDGRVVSRTLTQEFGTIVLFVTSLVVDSTMRGHGAGGLLRKPFLSEDIPKGLAALVRIATGEEPGRLPPQLIAPLEPAGETSRNR